jgi:hypothetical protein
MGYRSEIAIAIHKEVIGEFLTFLKTTKVMHEIFGEHGFTLDKDFQGKGHWLFTESQIKWYADYADDYPEVDAFEKFFDFMDEDDKTQDKYRFVRIGEEHDDLELRGYWYESELYVKTTIEVG